MLKGDVIQLRPVREADLEALYSFHQDITNRGEFYPLRIASETVFKERFAKSGYWSRDEGMLLIVGDADTILGHIEFFQTVDYLDELEVGYQLYSRQHDGRGIVTDALRLMTRYLFDTTKVNRIRLITHPDNRASQRVAEKCGFRHESTARGAWFHRGRNHDVEVYAQLRGDFNQQE